MKGRLFTLFDSILGATLWTGTASLMVVPFLMIVDVPPATIVTHIIVSTFSWWLIVRNEYGT